MTTLKSFLRPFIRHVLLESRLLLELDYKEVEARMSSDKFIRSCEFHKQKPEYVKMNLLANVPDDISDQDKANYLNWRIKQFMINGTYLRPSRSSIETFYMIKNNNLDHLLAQNDINRIESVEEFLWMMKDATEKYLEYQEEQAVMKVKPGDIKKIYEDERWQIFIPKSKAAAIKLGTGTTWCTASRGDKNKYEEYNGDDTPLIIFINKQDPTEKYQFYYGNEKRSTGQFMDKRDSSIERAPIFYELTNILISNCADDLPSSVIDKAKKYKIEYYENGSYRVQTPKLIASYDKDDKLHSEDDLPAAIYQNGDKFWYKHGKINRDGDLPAAILHDGETMQWYQDNLIHRDNDLPAIVGTDGFKQWRKHGKIHRDGDLPAWIFPGGQMQWFKDDKLHRDNDLPANIFANGSKMWFKNGFNYTPDKNKSKS
jgi:hypothetical protein